MPATPLMRARSPIAHLILENQEEAGDDVADQVLRAEADRQPGDARAGQDRHDVDRSSRSSIRIATKPTVDRHQAGENAAERGGAPLPFEVGGRVAPRQLELEMLDREIRGADHDERAGEDDDDVDAVRQPPSARAAADPSAARRRRTARARARRWQSPRRRRRAASARGSAAARARAPPRGSRRRRCRARRARRWIDGVRDAHDHRGDDEREHDGGNRRCSGSPASQSLDLKVVRVAARQVGADADEHGRAAGRRRARARRAAAPISAPASSRFSPMPMQTGTTPQ